MNSVVALGFPLHKLPEPLAGEPSYYRADNLIEDGDGAWIPMLPKTVDSGPDSDIWQGTLAGNVVRAMSLVPDEVRSLMDLLAVHYIELSQVPNWESSPRGTLSRIQTELIATRLSGINGCFY